VPPGTTLYVLLAHEPTSRFALVVRSELDPSALTPAVRGVIREVNREQPLGEVLTMNEIINHSVARPRTYTLLLSTFAIAAFALAMLGLNAALAASVVLRQQEMAVRVALGARPMDALSLVFRQGLLLVCLGILVGSAVAVASTRVLRNLLHGVGVLDPATFAAVGLLVLLAGAAAIALPARQAADSDPVEALRT